MTMTKANIKSLFTESKTNMYIALAVAAALLLSATLLILTHASGFFASSESENAALTANAKLITDASASGGKAIQFTAPVVTPPPPTPTPTPTPTPPPAGKPSASNTGYKNAPGYPGSLTTCNDSNLQSNTTYSFCNFTSSTYIGSTSNHPTNITFIGCRFSSNATEDANVAIYGDNITFKYSTFEPSADSAPPTTFSQGYQYGIDQRYNGRITVENSDFWGWGNGIQFNYSTQAKPFVVKNTWFHDARDDGGKDHTDAILENYGGPSYMVFDNNTISSVGNTNGLALQGPSYQNVTITNNYFSGFGYTVAMGVNRSNNQNIVFTGNTFGTEFKPVWGPLYGWDSGPGNLWRNNKWRVVPGSYYTPTTDDGKYWWPDGSKKTTDYAG